MNEYDAVKAVSDWGRKLSDAYKAQGRMCSGDRCTEPCRDSADISLSGLYSRMARGELSVLPSTLRFRVLRVLPWRLYVFAQGVTISTGSTSTEKLLKRL